MGKTNKSGASAAPAKKLEAAASPLLGNSDSKKRGWDEIADLFDKKKHDQEQVKKKVAAQRVEDDKERQRRRQRQKRNNDQERKADEFSAQASYNKTANKESWVDDGLGGKFNAEGFTGRVEDGVKIFKAHVLSKPNAGQTPLCPFDCDCCYI